MFSETLLLTIYVVPIDGALFIEFVPKNKQFLMSMMSVFFSFGATYTAGIAWAILPKYSCLNRNPSLDSNCHSVMGNVGWRILLFIVAGTNLFMFLCRVVFIRVEESPRFLLGKGRLTELGQVLKKIAIVNGKTELIEEIEESEFTLVSHGIDDDELTTIVVEDDDDALWNEKWTPQNVAINATAGFRNKLKFLFSSTWRRTTILVWLIWILESFAYNAFGQLVPMYLQALRIKSLPGVSLKEQSLSLEEIYRNFFFFTLATLPGPIVSFLLAWYSSILRPLLDWRKHFWEDEVPWHYPRF